MTQLQSQPNFEEHADALPILISLSKNPDFDISETINHVTPHLHFRSAGRYLHRQKTLRILLQRQHHHALPNQHQQHLPPRPNPIHQPMPAKRLLANLLPQKRPPLLPRRRHRLPQRLPHHLPRQPRLRRPHPPPKPHHPRRACQLSHLHQPQRHPTPRRRALRFRAHDLETGPCNRHPRPFADIQLDPRQAWPQG